MDDEQIGRILTAQKDRETRRRHAHDIIVNDRDLAALQHAIERLHQEYLDL